MVELYSCVAKRGSLADVERLLGQGQDVNYVKVNKGNKSILHKFCWCYGEKSGEETLKILKLLIEKGAVVDAVDEFDQTPLMLLVYKGFPVDHVGLLLSKGADVRYIRKETGSNVLHFFSDHPKTKIGANSLNLLKLLIEKGADVDTVNNNGWTPLTLLVNKGFPSDHIKILLKSGVSVHHKTKAGNTVLHCFSKGYNSKIGDDSLTILKLFVKYGCDVDTVNNYGNTPVKLLLEKKFPAEYLDVLLRKSSQVNREFKDGNILLNRFISLYSGKMTAKGLEILKVLIRFNSDVEFVNQNGDTPIKLLVEKKFPAEHLRVVLCKSTNINRKYAGGNTIFHHFIETYCSDVKEESLCVMKVLLEAGASVDIANEEGDTPLMLLMKKGFPVSYLEVAISRCNDINCKGKSGNTLMHHFTECWFDIDDNSMKKILSLLLESGGSVDIPNEKGDTPLMLLLRKGYPFDYVEEAVMRTKNINCKDVSGNTLIHHYIECYELNNWDDSLNLLGLLLQSGASVDEANKKGEMPLRLLLEKKYPVDHLHMALSASQDVNLKDKDDNNLLHNFVQLYHLETAEVGLNVLKSLIEFGVSVDTCNKNGETPLKLLLKKRCPIDYLEVALSKSCSVSSDETFLHYFVECYRNKINDESLKVLKLLVVSGANVHALNENEETLFMVFLKNRFPFDHITVILDKGVNVRGPFRNYPNVLHCILWTGNRLSSTDLFRLMLEYGADPNEIDAESTPILFSCIRANNITLARILCEHGSKIDWDSRWGRDIVLNYLKYGNRMDVLYETIFKYALLRDYRYFDRFFDNHVGDMGKLRRFVNASVKELEEMRGRRLNDRVMVYDLLSETDRRTLGEYLQQEDVGAGVETALVSGFPIYSDVIRSRLEIARRWAKVYENLVNISSMSVVSRSGVEVELNHYCVQHIARFLNNYHLKKFISASVSDLTVG